MKKLLGLLLATAMLSTIAFCEEEIQVGHVQAVSIGDSNTELTSEGENAEDVTNDSSEDDARASDATVCLTFEEGFSISMPSDWKYYDITDEMRSSGVIYAMSNAIGTNQAFIQLWDTECADIEELNTLIKNTSTPQTSGIHEFNGIPFIVYDLPRDDVSCAAALLGKKVLNIVFTPQSDSDFMLIAAKIMQSFKLD